MSRLVHSVVSTSICHYFPAARRLLGLPCLGDGDKVRFPMRHLCWKSCITSRGPPLGRALVTCFFLFFFFFCFWLCSEVSASCEMKCSLLKPPPSQSNPPQSLLRSRCASHISTIAGLPTCLFRSKLHSTQPFNRNAAPKNIQILIPNPHEDGGPHWMHSSLKEG